MTSPYLSHDQQSLCNVLTEKGSQETDEHHEIAQPRCPRPQARGSAFGLSGCWWSGEWGSPETSLGFWDIDVYHYTPGFIVPFRTELPCFLPLPGHFFSIVTSRSPWEGNEIIIHGSHFLFSQSSRKKTPEDHL